MRSKIKIDFPGLRIGSAEEEAGPTGCTVIRFDESAQAAFDARGGSVAARESELLSPISTWNSIDAIVFAGGSTYGLEAASGVMKSILKEREGKTDFSSIPSVPSAVVYDFGGRTSSHYPTRELGEAAYRNLKSEFVEIGRVGAGRNISVGKIAGREFSETGFLCAGFTKSATHRIFSLSAVNSLGNIVGLDGKIVAGSLDRKTGRRVDGSSVSGSRGNTTLTACVTDAPLSRSDLQRISMMVSHALSRVIQPYGTPYDGDIVYVATTARANELVLSTDAAMKIGMEIGDTAVRAILDTFIRSKTESKH